MAGTRLRDVTARRTRAGLLATTALTAAVLLHAAPARAQPAPNARPQGGQVVAGSASISTTPSATTINQSTQRAAINWNSFNVGSQQTVTFEQPSSTSMTLNRVTGPDPSAIAGRIDANGGIVITNPDGVVFYRGSQVNATDLVVSAPGISNRNFMAGRMVFNQPAKPGAAVVNRGNLTIRQAGLGALVAPEVRNRGTITARLGRVALAGGDAATLDMYGDGLVSIDVTRQVTRAPNGHDTLVTNTGVIEANGGTVQLTAAAADGVVTTLVDARGHIGAASVANHPGTVAIVGTGGALLVAGTVLAGGAQGGAIEIAGPGVVTVGPHARVSASGANSGGVVAVGTDLARASGGASVAPTVIARTVTVIRGAHVSANARQRGNGGTVTLLSTDTTVDNGRIAARGGTLSGNGGLVEISSDGGLGLTGSVDVGAVHGALGTILLDPGTLDIIAGMSGQGTADGTLIASGGTLAFGVPDSTSAVTVTNGAVDNLTGNIVLQATTLLTVSAPITLTIHGQGLTLQSSDNLTTSAAIKTAGNISLSAGNTLSVGGTIATTGGSVNLAGDTSIIIGGTSVAAPVTASGTIALSGGGIGVSTFAGSPITAGGSLTITGSVVSTGDSLVSQAGGITVDGTNMLTVSGPVNAPGEILLTGDDVNVNASVTGKNGSVSVTSNGGGLSVGGGTISAGGGITIIGGPEISVGDTLTAGGDISIEGGGGASITEPVTSTGGTVTISNTDVISLSAPVTAQTGDVDISGTDLILSASVTSVKGSVSLTGAGSLSLSGGTVTAGGGITLAGGSPVDISDTLTAAGGISIDGGGGQAVEINAPVTSTGGNVTISNTQFLSVTAPITAQTGNVNISGSEVETSSTIGAGGSATLAAASFVIIGAPVSVGAGQEIIASAPMVVVGGTLTVPGSPGTSQAAGPVNVLVQADSLTVNSPINAPGGIVALTPFTQGNPLTVDNSQPASAGPVLTTTELGMVNTGGGGLNGRLYLGGVGASQTPIAGTLSVNSPLSLPSGQSLGLFSAGSLAVGAAINLSGPAALTAVADTDLSTSAAITTAGSIALSATTAGNFDTNHLTLLAPVTTTGGSITLSASGIAIGTNVSAPAPLSASGTIGISGGTGGFTSFTGAPIKAGGDISVTGNILNFGDSIVSQSGKVTIVGADVLPGLITAFGDITLNGSDVNVGVVLSEPVTSTNGSVNLVGPVVSASAPVTASGTIAVTAGLDGVVFSSGASLQAGGNVALTSTSFVTIAAGVSAGAGHEITIAGALVTMSGSLTVPANTSAPQAGGPVNVLVEADSLSFTGPISAPGGIVAFTPYTAGNPLTVDNSQPNSPGPVLTTSELGLVNTSGGGLNGSLYLGGVGASQSPIAGNVSANSAITLPAGQSLSIFASGDVSLNAPVNLTGPAALTVQANGNIGTGAPITTQGNIDFSSTPSGEAPPTVISLGGAVTTTGGSITVSGPQVAIGSVNGGGTIEAPITASGGITVDGAYTQWNGSQLQAGGDISISGGAFAQVYGPINSTGGSVTLNGSTVTLGAAGANPPPAPVTANGAILVSAGAGGITENSPASLTAGGDVVLGSSGAVTLAGSVASTGGPVSIGGSTITVDGLVSAGTTVGINATAALTTGGGGTITSAGDIDLASAGEMTISPPVISSGNVSVTSSTGVTITDPIFSGAGHEILVAAPTVDIFAALNVPYSASAPQVGGPVNVLVQADTLAIGVSAGNMNTGGSIVAIGGIVALTPYTAGNPLTVENSGPVSPGPVLTTHELSLIQTHSGAVVGSLYLGGVGGNQPAVAGSVTFASPTPSLGAGGTIASTLGLFATGVVTEQPGGIITAGTLIGTAASMTLNSGNAIGNLGSFTSSAGFSLSNTVPLAIIGAVSDPTSVTLTDTGGGITEAPDGGGSLTTSLLTGGTNSSAQFANTNAVTALGSFAAAGGLTLVNSLPLTVSGPVTGGPLVSITDAGRIALTGPVTATVVGLTATGGALSETGAGVINAGTLTGGANVAALNNGNAVGNLGSFTSSNGFSLVDAVPLGIVGAVTDQTSIGLIDTGGAITETLGGGGSLNTGLLTGSTNSSAQFANANAVITLGSFAAPGGFTLVNTGPLAVSGPVTGGPLVNITAAGPLALTGPLTATVVGLTATGSTLAETGGGVINAGTLFGAAGAASLGNVNIVGLLGGFATTNGFALNDTVGLAIAGLVSAPSGTVSLVTQGALTEASGSIDAATLTGNATSAQLNGANVIGTLGSFSAPGGFALTDAQSLLVTGPVDPSSIAIVDARSIILTANISATNVSLIAENGAISQTAGVLTAGVLSGSAASGAQFGGVSSGTALVGTLGGFAVGTGAFVLADSEALTVTGPLTAPYFQVSAPGQITLEGATITTAGLPLASQASALPVAPGSNFEVTPVGGVGSFVQTGVATIQGLDGTKATVRIDVPLGSNIVLADLEAPTADIVLASPSGQVLGNVFADNLLVIGALGGSNLFGSILGVTTPYAAALGQIEPSINVAYLFNGCVIASATCSGGPGRVGNFSPTATLLLPTLSIGNLNAVLSDTDPPTLQPNGRAAQLVQFYIAFPPTLPGDSDPEIVLPNVSDQDY